MRKFPLVTIDPEDARDHDDAVWAGPDDDPGNKGGHIVIVAIADVAHYVTPGSELDREAWKRGNSAYFPDRVVPMLPERLSADLCSLVDNEDRPCLAVRMIFDKNGHKKRHEFLRAMMRSAATTHLSAKRNALSTASRTPRIARSTRPRSRRSWNAYQSLVIARDKRDPLNLDLPERRVIIGEDGKVKSIAFRDRLESMRVIEELMIQANVAAAESLEKARHAARLSHPRAPLERKALRVLRLSAHHRHELRQGTGGEARRVQPHPRAGEGRARMRKS